MSEQLCFLCGAPITGTKVAIWTQRAMVIPPAPLERAYAHPNCAAMLAHDDDDDDESEEGVEA